MEFFFCFIKLPFISRTIFRKITLFIDKNSFVSWTRPKVFSWIPKAAQTIPLKQTKIIIPFFFYINLLFNNKNIRLQLQNGKKKLH
ncbi:hypothetical protein BpHYR1_008832 [Brachionus plicatilis]|uniref:Uncharacterized protein n=1 Tax=Brachionus plicatilis TaxID=10195 RepID=A0A3M7R703_BRAPC|nr:hypothetical protein BpHYR1_008832 [Brachionus plicatilis]